MPVGQIPGVVDARLYVVPPALRILEPASELDGIGTMDRGTLFTGVGTDDQAEALAGTGIERLGVVVDVIHGASVGGESGC